MSEGRDSARSIAVVGSVNVDTSIELPSIPLPGETLLGSSHVRSVGGKGANQAVAASLFGADVFFVGCVGEDREAEMAVSRLNDMDVGTRSVAAVKAATGLATVLVVPGGENAIVVTPGANSHLTPARCSSVRDDWAYRDMVVLQCEVPRETVEFVARDAASEGARVIINVAPAVRLAAEILAACDPLVVNVLEGEALLDGRATGGPGIADIDEADGLVRRLVEELRPRSLVLTLGGAGSVGMDRRGVVVHCPGLPVSVVDTSGAGDCFVGALAAQLVQRRSLAQAMRFATAASALAVTRRGAQSYPTRREVEEFLARTAVPEQPISPIPTDRLL